MRSFARIIAVVALSALLVGCADQLRDPDPIFTTDVNEDLHTKLNEHATAFNSTVLDAADDPENSQKVTKFLDAGLSVANTICISYLRYVEGIHSNLNFSRQQANLLGGAVAGILGLLEAATIEVAGAGIGFSLLDASLETYQDVYLIAPEFGDVRDLVEKAQSEVQTQLAANPPATYPAAKSALESYFHICSHEGMRMLVRKAVKSGEPIATFGRGARDRFGRLIADQKANELASELGVPVLGRERLVGLYWIFAEGTGLDDKYLPYVKGLLGTKLAEKTIAPENDLNPNVKKNVTKIQGLLNDLNEAHGGILGKRVTVYKATVNQITEANDTIETVATEISNLREILKGDLDQAAIDKLKSDAASLRQRLIDPKAVIDQRGDKDSKAIAKKVLQDLEETEKTIENRSPGPAPGPAPGLAAPALAVELAPEPETFEPRAIPAPPMARPAGGRLIIEVQ